MRVLNLYAGIGGNRKYWANCEVTAVEYNSDIASVYQKLYPDDIVIVSDAHEYLRVNYDKFDFIWSSPPCQSHSRMMKATRHRLDRYPDMTLYQQIIYLQNFYKGKWVVENVNPYYTPLVEPYKKVGRHLFWSNFEFECEDVKRPANFINNTNKQGRLQLQEWLGIKFDEVLYYEGNHCPAQVLRNAVHPEIGRAIYAAARTAHGACQWG